ncbi:hypothetical protein PSH84_08495 [Pseudomonas beijingensis]|uniref:hypothetical protein n=1 Tax=Pseudomonas beijingensis TaxID=2954101 RepID=UPI002736D56B|nr:hypothetical protein [Pseudomonas sp. FP830]WLI46896.1 hypothetical protein PSH84_08495 [Pseudomonas sp. FP830]
MAATDPDLLVPADKNAQQEIFDANGSFGDYLKHCDNATGLNAMDRLPTLYANHLVRTPL